MLIIKRAKYIRCFNIERSSCRVEIKLKHISNKHSAQLVKSVMHKLNIGKPPLVCRQVPNARPYMAMLAIILNKVTY